MIENPRFWLALILYFSSAALSAGVWAYRKKKSPMPLFIYLILALTASIALWVYAGAVEYSFNEALNLINLSFILLGALNGIAPYLLPLLIILPLLFSLIYKIPIAPLMPEKKIVQGELYFYPGNDGSVNVGWIKDGAEQIISLKGSKAGVLFISKNVPQQYFFLKNSLYPMAILSESQPVSNLAHPDPDWYYSLLSSDEAESVLYEISYPAVKYHDTGYFSSYSYISDKGRIVIQRK